jgi:hypothetical protein
VLPYAPPEKAGRVWPVHILLPTLAITWLLQSQILPCACAGGKIKVFTGQTLILLVALRICVALLLKERNYHWVIYLGLVVWSLFWIPLLFD